MAELFAPLIDKETKLLPIAGMDEPFYYRNKVVSPFAPGRRIPHTEDAKNGTPNAKNARARAADSAAGSAAGSAAEQDAARTAKGARGKRTNKPEREILCGMYAAGTHRIVATDDCRIENRIAKQIVLTVRDLMPAFNIAPYREDVGDGFLRHVVVRVGHTSGEVLVTLVTNARQFPGSKAFVRELLKRCPRITSVVQNINTRQTNVILGESEIRLFGPGFILDRLCGLSFRISSQSFYQVNAVQTEVLYRCAIELARLTGSETVIDAYCGTGTIGLVAARGIHEGAHAARVIGVDEVASAIADARANAKHNGITNAEFVTADAGAFMRNLAEEGEQVDVVLMDPPRAGSTEEFLSALCVLAPSRVVYISCNPRTQARDVTFLNRHGYRLDAIQPVDMFPHTEHVETVCSLSRKDE